MTNQPEPHDSPSSIYLIRPIERKDEESFIRLAKGAGIGIVTLPKEDLLLQQKIEFSLRSFSKDVVSPDHENYLFVIEDPLTGQIGGCSAIHSRTAVIEDDYRYKLKSIYPTQILPEIPEELALLYPTTYRLGPSAVCTLYLSPEFRKSGLGHLLSLSRFLFIAGHQNRFEKKIIADIRGKITKDGIAPFWEGLGRHFFSVPYDTLMGILPKGTSFISEILPKHPIYVSLLPKEAQEAIGKVHDESSPVLNMLKKEGFIITNEINPFDGGPIVEANIAELRTVKESKSVTIKEIRKLSPQPRRVMACNDKLDFRACYANLEGDPDSEQEMAIDEETAKLLQVQIGDNLRFMEIKK